MKYRACKLFGFVLFVCSQEKSNNLPKNSLMVLTCLGLLEFERETQAKVFKKNKRKPSQHINQNPRKHSCDHVQPGVY